MNSVIRQSDISTGTSMSTTLTNCSGRYFLPSVQNGHSFNSTCNSYISENCNLSNNYWGPKQIQCTTPFLTCHDGTLWNMHNYDWYSCNSNVMPPTTSSIVDMNAMIEPIKLTLHETNGQYHIEYDADLLSRQNYDQTIENIISCNNSISYYDSVQHQEYMESLKKKILNNELDLFCHICNYGFKSFPRLIRHMETKRHAIQIERFRTMNSKNITKEKMKPSCMSDSLNENDIQNILNSFIDEFESKEDLFNDIEPSDLPDVTNLL